MASTWYIVQRSAKRLVHGCEKYVPALAYLFCLALPGSCLARFAYFLADLCTLYIVIPLFSQEFLRMRRSQTSRHLIRRQCTCYAVNSKRSYGIWWPLKAGRVPASGVIPTPRETAATSQALRRPKMKFAALALAVVLMNTSSDAKSSFPYSTREGWIIGAGSEARLLM